LTQIFDKNPPNQQELLNSYYGNQKMSTGLATVSFDNGGAFSNRRSASVDDQTQTTSTIDQTKTTSSLFQISGTQSSSLFSQRMFSRMSPLMDNQERDLAQVNFSDVKDFSQYFDTLGKQLLSIKTVL